MTHPTELGDGKSVEVVDVDATWASLLLENVPGQRKIVWTRVTRYANAMLEGRWRGLNGQTIKLGKNDELKDGMHRMLAVQTAAAKKPDISVRMMVVFGISGEDMLTIDTGLNRTFRNVLQMQNRSWSTHLATATGVLYRYLNDKWLETSRNPENDVLNALLGEHPGLEDWLAYADTTYKTCRLPRPATNVSLYAIGLHHEDEDHVREFAEKLQSGTDLPRGSPILALRDYGIRGNFRASDTRRSYKNAVIATIKAFNYWTRGMELYLMRVLKDDKVPDVVQAKVGR